MGLALCGGPSWSVALCSRQTDSEIIANRREGFQRHVAPALNGQFLRLLHQDGAHEAADRGLVRKDADDVCAPLDLAVETLNRIRGVQLGAVLLREGRRARRFLRKAG